MTEAEVEISESDKGVEEPNLISEPPTSNGGVNDESEAGNLIDEEEETGPELVHNICILPPLQSSPSLNKTSYEDAIVLPPIQAFEPVGSIRAALSEVKGFAHLTNYHLIAEVISEEESKDIRGHVAQKNTRDSVSLENEAAAAAAVKKSSNGNDNTSGGSGKKKKKKNEKPKSETATTKTVPSSQVVSPYTLKDAVIAVPSSHSSLVSEESESEATSTEVYLNDYGDLTPLVEKNLLKSNETAFRLVLERYDVGAIHDHVARFRNLCDGNTPYLNTLNGNESEEREEDEAAGGDKKNAEVEGQALKEVKQKEESADTQSVR
jgi:protein TIF31